VANASTLTVTPVKYSLEGQTIYGSTGVTTLPDILVTLNADYTLSDNITLLIAGATVGGATSTLLNSNAGTFAVPANGIHCYTAGGADNPLIVSLIVVTGNSIALRVTQKTATSTVGDLCLIRGIQVTSPSIAVLTTVTATWAAATATTNIAFDASTPSPTTLASTISQFTSNWGATPTVGLSGIVDVTSGRKWFFGSATGNVAAGPAAATNTDVTTATTSDLATGPSASGLATAGNFFAVGSPIATLTNTTFTLNGTFTELTGVGGCTTATSASGLTVTLAGGGTQVVTIPLTCAAITDVVTPTAAGQSPVVTFTFSGGEGQVIPAPQVFTASMKFAYTGTIAAGGTGSGSRTDAASNPGAWTLNGFSAFVSYMPFGTGISQILYLTNKSSQTGAITIVGYNDQGAVLTSFAAGSIGPGKVIALTTSLVNAVTAAYGATFTGKVSFNVIANIPAGQAELYSAYNVSGNRVSVLNTSNGRVTLSPGNSTTGTGL
jgi:hypothetical protein